MHLVVALVVLFTTCGGSLGDNEHKVSYDGYQLWRVSPTTTEQMTALMQLEEQNFEKLDFWKPPSAELPGDICVSPTYLATFRTFLAQNNIPYSIIQKNIQDLIDEEAQSIMPEAQLRDHIPDVPDTYTSYSMIWGWMDFMRFMFPDLVTTQVIGRTIENRPIVIMKLSVQSNTPKPAVWMDAAFHAREWITIPTILSIAKKIVAGYYTGRDKSLLTKFDWYFLPVGNPDGYAYTKTVRLWRKNRRPAPSGWRSNCDGVDLNRNFNVSFYGEGSSTYPCSQIYHGPEPFSEPETVAVRDFINTIAPPTGRLKAYISLHCYGQMWLTPFGYRRERPENAEELDRIARVGRNALFKVNGTSFRIGTPPSILYIASGSSMDWVVVEAGVRFAYTLELIPDLRNRNGFILPAAYIKQSAAEVFEGVRATVNAIYEEP